MEATSFHDVFKDLYKSAHLSDLKLRLLPAEEEEAGAEDADAKDGAAAGEAAADGGWVKLPKGGVAKSPVKEAKKSK
jgi:hypothetical protein